ncbi:MAG: shikimate dehydrogenase family protein [Clostridia bacterium]
MSELHGFAVLGRPIAHSLSPVLHTAGFRARGMSDCRYDAVLVDAPDQWLAVTERLRVQGYRGFNLTRPLKALAAASPRVAVHDPWGLSTGAVNTLTVLDGRLYGANTDAPALLESLSERGIRPTQALVFGSGGAARASVAALEALGAAVTLAARRGDGFPGRWVDFAQGLGMAEGADVIVNATPLGQAHEAAWERVPCIGAGQVAVDWVYAPPMTPFLEAAGQRGARLIGGLELLVRQAALSWVHWFDEPGPLLEMGRAVGWAPA